MPVKMNIANAINSLLEEEEEEDILLFGLCNKTRRKRRKLFLNRKTEGCFRLLITSHLIDDGTKFQEYFRLTKDEFDAIYEIVSEDLRAVPSTFVSNPISGCEKFALTLR